MSKQVEMALAIINSLIEKADKHSEPKGQLTLARVYLEEELEKDSAIRYAKDFYDTKE